MSLVLGWLGQEVAEEDFDLYETVLANRERESERILRESLEILSDPNLQKYWHSSSAIIYWLLPMPDQIEIPKMAIVARLYWCLIQDGDSMDEAENLVWSIAKDLKGVEYLSEWEPMKDPEVAKYLAAMG